MNIDVSNYKAEKEAREKRLLAFGERIQEATMDMSAEIIAELVEERHNQNMTQQEVSDMTGILPSNLARFESGKRIPTLLVLQKYATALGKEIKLQIVDAENQ